MANNVAVPSCRMCSERCTRLRRSLVVVLIVLLVAAVLSTVMFSSWNVCRPNYDDDVDAEIAASMSTRSSRRSSKTCLSPLTDTGVRVNISLDSDDDLQRYAVGPSAAKPYTSIIHTMWNTAEVPKSWQRSAESWVRKNEQFVYCHWTLAELEVFVADEYPWLLSTYLAYPYVIQRCDAARYLLLYRYGGTYVDLDIRSKVNMSVIFGAAPVDAGVLVASTEPVGLATEFIAVRRARDPAIRRLISGLRRAAASPWYLPLPYTAVMFRTGPVYFTRRLNCHGGEGGVFVIPSSKYYGTYVDHVKGSSWHAWDGRLIWHLYLLQQRLRRNMSHAKLAAYAAIFLLFFWIVRSRRFICIFISPKKW